MRQGGDPQQFKRVVAEIVGSERVRRVARSAGISHTALYDMLDGSIPTYELLTRVADNLALDRGTRESLFEAAGHKRAEAPPEELSPVARQIARQVDALRPEQLAVVRQLLATWQPDRLAGALG